MWWKTLVFSILVLVPERAEARFLYESPADILRIRGMPVAVAVCLIGLLFLRHTPAADSHETAPAGARDPRPGLWLVVGAFVLFLFSTIPMGYPIARAIVLRIGHDAWQSSLNGVAAILGVGLLWHLFRRRELRRLSIVLWSAGVAAAYLYFFSVLEVPVKRIHFMEYSFLSFLVYRALQSRNAPAQIYLWCALAAMLVGMSEEALSLLSERRFGAVSDVVWDSTGGLLGTLVVKYVVAERGTVSREPEPAAVEAV